MPETTEKPDYLHELPCAYCHSPSHCVAECEDHKAFEQGIDSFLASRFGG